MPAHKKTFSPLKALGRVAKKQLIDKPINNAKEKVNAKKEAISKSKAAAAVRAVRGPVGKCMVCGNKAKGKGEGLLCSPECARAYAQDMW